MFKRMVRHSVVGVALAAVAGVATAGALGFVNAPKGSAEIEFLETMPVMHGDLGEVTVVASRRDLPEVVVAGKRVPVADGLMADITVTGKRVRPSVVEMATVAGVAGTALVQ
jgi:hypothetical protein